MYNLMSVADVASVPWSQIILGFVVYQKLFFLFCFGFFLSWVRSSWIRRSWSTENASPWRYGNVLPKCMGGGGGVCVLILHTATPVEKILQCEKISVVWMIWPSHIHLMSGSYLLGQLHCREIDFHSAGTEPPVVGAAVIFTSPLSEDVTSTHVESIRLCFSTTNNMILSVSTVVAQVDLTRLSHRSTGVEASPWELTWEPQLIFCDIFHGLIKG